MAFEDPLTNQALEDETSFVSQRIQNYNQVPPSSTKYPTYRDNQILQPPE